MSVSAPQLIVLVIDPFFESRQKFINSCGFDTQGIQGFVYPQPLKRELPRCYGKRVADLQVKHMTDQQLTGHPVCIGMVTTVYCGRTIIGLHPQEDPQVRLILQKLSGRRHRILTTVAYKNHDQIRYKQIETAVQWKCLNSWEVDRFIDTVNHQQKIGGYLPVTHHAERFIKSVNGMPSNLTGVPALMMSNLLNGLR